MKKAERAAIFKALCKMALIAYVFLMLWLLFFQRLQQDVPGAYFERLKENFNLFPFLTIRDFIRTVQRSANPALVRFAVINLVGNIVMFIPLGFLPPCVYARWRIFGRCMGYAAACICFVEVVQLITLTGSCDIDDFILNMVGTALGYLLYRAAAARLAKRRPHTLVKTGPAVGRDRF